MILNPHSILQKKKNILLNQQIYSKKPTTKPQNYKIFTKIIA